MAVPERPVLVAPDSFKGTFRASEVAGAIGRGLERAGLMPPDLCPVADGGEGTLDALLPGLGGEVVAADAHDPLGRELTGCFGAGRGRRDRDRRDRDGERAWRWSPRASATPGRASTYGTGELIAAAAAAGAAVIIVAVGGSATTDGGAGALEAIEEAGGLGGAKLVVLCDVRTPFEHAPKVFGPQKGADEAMVKRLEERLDALAGELAARPARRADDRLRRRPVRRAVGRPPRRRSSRARRGCSTRSTSTRACAPRARWSPARASSTSRRCRASSSARSAPARARPACRCTRSSAPTRSTPFGKRMIDLMRVIEATDLAELEAAGETLGRELAAGAA